MKYIVYITHYKGTKLPPWYIGSSNKDKINDGYNGSVSSKKYKEIYIKEQKENKTLFRTKILSYHKTRQEALDEELRLQKMHKVMTNDRYFNESYASVNGSHGRDVSGELNPNYGNSLSQEMRNKISNASKNMLVVRNKITNKVSRVTKDEWNSNSDLEAESKGRKIDNTKKYAHNGSSNNAALRIDIYDSNNILRFSCDGNFKDVCDSNNLPFSSLYSTYRKETVVKYGKYNIKNAKKKGWYKFQGWYARKI